MFPAWDDPRPEATTVDRYADRRGCYSLPIRQPEGYSGMTNLNYRGHGFARETTVYSPLPRDWTQIARLLTYRRVLCPQCGYVILLDSEDGELRQERWLTKDGSATTRGRRSIAVRAGRAMRLSYLLLRAAFCLLGLLAMTLLQLSLWTLGACILGSPRTTRRQPISRDVALPAARWKNALTHTHWESWRKLNWTPRRRSTRGGEKAE